MQDIAFWSLAVNVLFGIAGYALREMVKDLKDRTLALELAQKQYVNKEDFREFKEELWRKLDKIEIDVKEAVQVKK